MCSRTIQWLLQQLQKIRLQKQTKPSKKFSKEPSLKPHLDWESRLGFFLKSPNDSSPLIIGVDEVGRGCLAGPVVAAAAALRPEGTEGFDRNPNHPLFEVRDSKQVPESQREALSNQVKSAVWGYAVAEASVVEIEQFNILRASHLAMVRAIEALETSLGRLADAILIDGNQIPRDLAGRNCVLQAVVKGDQQSLTISCASIIAKVFRDEMMEDLDEQYPNYGLAKHKGYPTPYHRLQIQTLGALPIHRKTFQLTSRAKWIETR